MVEQNNMNDSPQPPPVHRELIIVAMLVAVSLSHYFTGFKIEQIHDVYTRLYYIPIILAAFWFGVRGGVVASVAAIALFLPHVFFQWRAHAAHGHFSQYVEMGMFVAIGIVTGFFAGSEKLQRLRAQDALARLEETFEKAKQAERLAAIGQLSAGVAHEVRNPLAGIKGALEILLADISPDNEKHRFVDIVNKEIARLESLVTEFLHFARPKQPEMAPGNINALARSVIEISAKHFIDNKINIDLRLDEALPATFMDSNQIRQVILNLALNAAQAMPGGGTLTVRTYLKGSNIFIEIDDTGAGIPDGCEESIFAPFYTTRTGGTGLGLAVSRQIIRSHGGDICAGAASGRGAAFIISLPIMKEAPGHAE